VLPSLVVGVPAAALFFGVKDGVASLAAARGLGDGAPVEALAVTAANGPYWLARAPAELLKTRQQLAGPAARPLRAAVADVLAEDGARGLYAGYAESFCYAVPADLVKFLAYRSLKKKFAPADVAAKAALGAAAAATANLVTTPLDVVKTRALEAGDGGVAIPARALAIARDEGPFALYAGVAPRLLRAVVSGGLQFGSYEFTKRLFRSS